MVMSVRRSIVKNLKQEGLGGVRNRISMFPFDQCLSLYRGTWFYFGFVGEGVRMRGFGMRDGMTGSLGEKI